MYFTDLSNAELQMFRKQNIKDNISLTLGKAKQSKLFHIKTITDTIVKIYPLFYCKSITSNNEEDYILGENKCIVAENKNDTIFNFEVDDTAPIVLTRLDGYHDVKETLTMPEFNKMIYIKRHSDDLTDNINLEIIKNNLISGEYGDYEFNFEYDSIVDDGILITRKTLEYPSTINLKGRTFKDSTYTATFTYYSITDYNILDDASWDNIVYNTVSVELEPYTPVVIPFEQLDEGIIVGFNVNISIKHDKPIIRYDRSLILRANTYRQELGEPVVLTATYRDEHGEPVADIPITFKESNTVLATVNTDSDGEATYTYNPATDGMKYLTASFDVYNSNEIEVEYYYNAPAHISLTSNKSILSYKDNESCTLTATVTNTDNEPCVYTRVMLNTYLMNEPVNIGQTVYPDRKIGDSYQVLVNNGTVVIGGVNNQIQISNAGVNVISAGSTVKSWTTPYPEVFIRNNILSVDDEDYDLTGKNIDTNVLYSLSPVANTVNCSIIQMHELITNSNGVATYTYNSLGTGDIMFEVSSGMIVSNAISVEDCSYYYNGSFIRSDMSVDISLPKYDYEITYRTAIQYTGGLAYLILNNGSTDTVVGTNSSNGQNGIYPSPLTNTRITDVGADVRFTYSQIDAEYTYNWGDVFLYKDNITNPANKITHIVGEELAVIGNIKVKPLYTPQVIDLQVSATKDILSYADGDFATVNMNVYPSLPNKVVNVYKNNVFYNSFVTDAAGECSFLYESEGAGDVEFRFECSSVIETYDIIDAYKYTSDGSTLDGTFTVTDGYITNCQSDTGITNFDLTGDFEFAYKYYNANPTNNNHEYNSLWVFGLDNNNGVFLGCEDQDKKIRVYNQDNGSLTTIQQITNAYNRNEWIDVSIKYVNGEWSIIVGANTITYSKTFNPTFIHFFDNYPLTRIKEILIKPL